MVTDSCALEKLNRSEIGWPKKISPSRGITRGSPCGAGTCQTGMPALVPICSKRFYRHYSGQPALLHRRYKGTRSALLRALPRRLTPSPSPFTRSRNCLFFFADLFITYFTLYVSRVGGGTQFVHGRSRMAIDPRIPTMPERSTPGFHQPGRHCLHQARSAVRCSTNRMKGELHSSKNRS